MEDFEEWARARSAALARSAYLLTGDLHHAEDLAQETLVRVALRWGRLARDGSPDAFVRVMMHRLSIDSWRRLRVRPRERLRPPPQLRVHVVGDVADLKRLGHLVTLRAREQMCSA